MEYYDFIIFINWGIMNERRKLRVEENKKNQFDKYFGYWIL